MTGKNFVRVGGRALRQSGHGAMLGLLLVTGALTASVPAGAGAQLVRAERAGNLTRAELEAAAQAAERKGAAGRTEAAALRARLASGDFQAGDRIVVELRGDSALFDTLTVRSGQVVRMPGVPDVPLHGVLRSELEPHLTQFLTRYIRHPSVRAESLVRLAVLGEVGKPGFYDFASDMLLTDAIMAAGGPTPDAAINRSKIVRGGTVILAKNDIQRAATSGATLDRLGLRPGDAITVGEKKLRSWQTIATVLGIATSLAFTISYLAR